MENYHVELNSIFHAFADPTRRAVYQQLGKGHATVSELAEPFDMALPSFMKHIRVLESADLISSTKVGRVRTCKIEIQKIKVVENWLSIQRSLWENHHDRLALFVEGLNTQGQSNDQ